MPGVIVPRKVVAEIIKLLDDGQAAVEVSLSPAKIRFAVGDVVLTSKLIDGSFPDYARVIPAGNKKFLVLENADLQKAVDRVSTLSSEKGRAVKLVASEGNVVVSASNPDSGSATEEISADFKQEPIEIGFNARYLLDIAGQIDGSQGAVQAGRRLLAHADLRRERRQGAVCADAHAGVAAGRLAE